MIAGEALGAWRWAGLLALSELRHLRHVGDLGAAARQNDELAQHLDTIGEAAEDFGASTKQFIDDVADAAPCLLKNSFDADTPVQTPDGEVPISEITVGSLVLGYDEATGKTGTFTVTDVISHTDPLQIKLTLDGEQIDTTPEHPFFVLLRGWVDAGELQVGDQVRTLDGGYGRVEAVEVVAETEVMYNLTVAQAHTFFVGEEGWLVHNACREDIRELTRNLRAAGWNQPRGTAAHHIVPTDERYTSAAEARWWMDYFDIGLNDAENGVFLPQNLANVGPNTGGVHHRLIHTNDYYDEVLARLQTARNRDEAIDILEGIRDELLLDTFPY